MKRYKFPILPHILKYLWYEYPKCFNEKGHFLINRRANFDLYRSHNKAHIAFFENPPDSRVNLYVIVRYISLANRYSLIRNWENSFRIRMVWETEAIVNAGGEAKQGIQQFLDKYDICEEELKVSTAYMYWKRYRNKKKTNNNTMLCPII